MSLYSHFRVHAGVICLGNSSHQGYKVTGRFLIVFLGTVTEISELGRVLLADRARSLT